MTRLALLALVAVMACGEVTAPPVADQPPAVQPVLRFTTWCKPTQLFAFEIDGLRFVPDSTYPDAYWFLLDAGDSMEWPTTRGTHTFRYRRISVSATVLGGAYHDVAVDSVGVVIACPPSSHIAEPPR